MGRYAAEALLNFTLDGPALHAKEQKRIVSPLRSLGCYDDLVKQGRSEWYAPASMTLQDSHAPYDASKCRTTKFFLPGSKEVGSFHLTLSHLLTKLALSLTVEALGEDVLFTSGQPDAAKVRAILIEPGARVVKVELNGIGLLWLEDSKRTSRLVYLQRADGEARSIQLNGSVAELYFCSLFRCESSQFGGARLYNGNWSDTLELFCRKFTLSEYVDHLWLTPRLGFRWGELYEKSPESILQLPEGASDEEFRRARDHRLSTWTQDNTKSLQDQFSVLGQVLSESEKKELPRLLTALCERYEDAFRQVQALRAPPEASPEPENECEEASSGFALSKKYGISKHSADNVVFMASQDLLNFVELYCVKYNGDYFWRSDNEGKTLAFLDFGTKMDCKDLVGLYANHIGHLHYKKRNSDCRLCALQWHHQDLEQCRGDIQQMFQKLYGKSSSLKTVEQALRIAMVESPVLQDHLFAFENAVWDLAHCRWLTHQFVVDQGFVASIAHIERTVDTNGPNSHEMSVQAFLESHPLWTSLLRLSEDNWLPICGLLGALLVPRNYKVNPSDVAALDEWQLILQVIGDPGKGKTQLMRVLLSLLGSLGTEIEGSTLESRWANSLLKTRNARLVAVDEMSHCTKLTKSLYNRLDGSPLAESETKYGMKLDCSQQPINFIYFGNGSLPIFDYSMARRTVCLDFDELVGSVQHPIPNIGKRIVEQELPQVLISLSQAFFQLRDAVYGQDLWSFLAKRYPFIDRWTARMDSLGILDVYYEWLEQGGIQPCRGDASCPSQCPGAITKRKLEQVLSHLFVTACQRQEDMMQMPKKTPRWFMAFVEQHLNRRRGMTRTNERSGFRFPGFHIALETLRADGQSDPSAPATVPFFVIPESPPRQQSRQLTLQDCTGQKRVRETPGSGNSRPSKKRGQCQHCGRTCWGYLSSCAVVAYGDEDLEPFCEAKPNDFDRALDEMNAKYGRLDFDVRYYHKVDRGSENNENQDTSNQTPTGTRKTKPKNILRKRCSFIDDEAEESGDEADLAPTQIEEDDSTQDNSDIRDFIVDEEVEDDGPPRNLCLECGEPLGPENPRQLCGKTRCNSFWHQVFTGTIGPPPAFNEPSDDSPKPSGRPSLSQFR